MLAAASTLVATLVPHLHAAAQDQAQTNIQLAQVGIQNTPAPNSTIEPRSGTQGQAITPNVSASAPENIIVQARRRLLKDKNSPSAVTELGAAQIAATGVSGSPATLLRQAPSIYVYQQGLGDNAPEITVRGLRGLEIATTLDGVPTQDLLAPGSFYLANNLGGVFTLSQINGVSIYPGVAYPDKNTFGTIGGTIAYDSHRPTNDRYLDITGSVGSFGTFKEGFEFNTGAIDSPLGSGDNAIKALLSYNNLQTQGFIDGTPNRENEMEFALDKPYNDGLSDLQVTAIYNTANGLIQNEPVPRPYLERNGEFSNYPTSLDFASQRNDFFTLIVKDDTEVNDVFKVGATAFYLHNDNELNTYGDVNLFQASGATPSRLSIPSPTGLVNPFINNPAAFGESGLFGPPIGDPLGIYGSGIGGYLYAHGSKFNPSVQYPAGSKYCPAAFAASWLAATGVAGLNPCGINDQITTATSDTYGIQPRISITPPDFFGIGNSIKIGGLIAKEVSPTNQTYLGGGPNTALTTANLEVPTTGGTQRTIYQFYAQDRIDLLDNTLHITPGLTAEGTYSDLVSANAFNAKSSPYYGPNGFFNGGTDIYRYGEFKAKKWDREYLPFFNVSYDFDKLFPRLKGLTIYGSTGESALFAPVTDFGPNTAGAVPNASIVHLYEGGIKYNASDLSLTLDYYYQKIDRDFGFFNNQNPGPNFLNNFFTNDGQREIKGFEASGIYQVTPHIQLFGNVSHLLAKYLVSALASTTVSEDQFGVGIKGTPVTGIPDWLSTFGVNYNQKSLLRDGDDLNARLTGQYTGHQYTSYDLVGNSVLQVFGVSGVNYSKDPSKNTQAAVLLGATTYDPHGGISPFAIFNLDLNYTVPTPQLPMLKKVTFDLNVQNLFNQFYYQYFYKQVSPSASKCPATAANPAQSPYGCGPQYSDDIPGQPFSVFFTVTARF